MYVICTMTNLHLNVENQIAIKTLKASTSRDEFLFENQHLSCIATPSHTSITQKLLAFILDEPEGDEVSLNFIFPLALGNLRQLLDDILRHEALGQVENFWGEFEGLTLGVQFLDEYCRIAQRDIRPSNVLIFEDQATSRLKLKMADFGIAIDLDGVPEMRRIRLGTSWRGVPNEEDLKSRDIYKLGGVFVELLTFLVLGVKGMQTFRDFVTVEMANFSSDSLKQIDHRRQIKEEVLEWLVTLSRQSKAAAKIKPLLTSMLGPARHRPGVGHIVDEIRKESLPNVVQCRTLTSRRCPSMPIEMVLEFSDLQHRLRCENCILSICSTTPKKVLRLYLTIPLTGGP